LEGGPFQDAGLFAGLKAGSYQLTVMDMLGCTAEIIVEVNQPPPLLVDAGPDVTIELGFGTTITALVQPSLNGVDLSWTPNEFIDCAVCPTINANPVNTTTYTVTVTDQAGCTASDEMTVVVLKIRRIYIPNSFSPDFNGINDNFTIYGGIGAESIVELRIYNRWGGLIFEGFDLPLGSEPDGWDGTFKGRVLDPEVFAYYALIRFIDEEIILYKGDIQLIR
jgi:gliding motility-associated-like protein